MCLAVIGIENQTEINYVMSVRGMLYDALNYASQIADFKKANHTEKKLKASAEFLSGITSECRLKPVITIVLYWGAEKWDAPRSLHEICEISDNHMFQTELGTALAAVQASGDKSKLYALVHSNPAYQKLDTDTMKLLSVLLSFKFSQESEKEGGNMCKAVEELFQEGIERGREEGREELLSKLKEFGYLPGDFDIKMLDAADKITSTPQ